MSYSIMVEVFVEEKDLSSAYSKINRAMKIATEKSSGMSCEITDLWRDENDELITFGEIKEAIWTTGQDR